MGQEFQYVGLLGRVAQLRGGLGYSLLVSDEADEADPFGSRPRLLKFRVLDDYPLASQLIYDRAWVLYLKGPRQVFNPLLALLAQELDHPLLFWRQVFADLLIRRFAQLHGELGALFQARRQHQAQAVNEGSEVVAADPAGQLDLYRGKGRLRVNDLLNIPGLGYRRPVGQVHHDALQAARTKGHLHQLTDGYFLPEGRRDGVMKGQAQRAVFVLRAFFPKA